MGEGGGNRVVIGEEICEGDCRSMRRGERKVWSDKRIGRGCVEWVREVVWCFIMEGKGEGGCLV